MEEGQEAFKMEHFVKGLLKPKELVSQLKDTNWVNKSGLLFYLLFGINYATESTIVQRFDFDYGLEDFPIFITVVVVLGILIALFFRLIWVNIIFLIGKIWKGQATKRNIDTVLAVSMFPEIFKFIYLVGLVISQRGLNDLEVNFGIMVICSIISFRILIVGISSVQRFSIGLSLLNLVLPQLVLMLIYLTYRGF